MAAITPSQGFPFPIVLEAALELLDQTRFPIAQPLPQSDSIQVQHPELLRLVLEALAFFEMTDTLLSQEIHEALQAQPDSDTFKEGLRALLASLPDMAETETLRTALNHLLEQLEQQSAESARTATTKEALSLARTSGPKTMGQPGTPEQPALVLAELTPNASSASQRLDVSQPPTAEADLADRVHTAVERVALAIDSKISSALRQLFEVLPSSPKNMPTRFTEQAPSYEGPSIHARSLAELISIVSPKSHQAVQLPFLSAARSLLLLVAISVEAEKLKMSEELSLAGGNPIPSESIDDLILGLESEVNPSKVELSPHTRVIHLIRNLFSIPPSISMLSQLSISPAEFERMQTEITHLIHQLGRVISDRSPEETREWMAASWGQFQIDPHALQHHLDLLFGALFPRTPRRTQKTRRRERKNSDEQFLGMFFSMLGFRT